GSFLCHAHSVVRCPASVTGSVPPTIVPRSEGGCGLTPLEARRAGTRGGRRAGLGGRDRDGRVGVRVPVAIPVAVPAVAVAEAVVEEHNPLGGAARVGVLVRLGRVRAEQVPGRAAEVRGRERLRRGVQELLLHEVVPDGGGLLTAVALQAGQPVEGLPPGGRCALLVGRRRTAGHLLRAALLVGE